MARFLIYLCCFGTAVACSSETSSSTGPEAGIGDGGTAGASPSGGGATSSAGSGGATSSGGQGAGVNGGASADGGAGTSGGASASGGSTNLGDASTGGAVPDADVATGVASDHPFGIASSASSSRSLSGWAADISATGITWLRGFDTGAVDDRLNTASANNLNVSGILLFGGPGSTLTFPVADLPGWTKYVTDLVSQCKGRVRYWEMWNEPPNFTDDKSPASYATIVSKGYDAAKAVDASTQIGLAAQSVNVSFLEQAIDAGAADHFDYVTVHPYETLGMVADGWEAQYLSVVPTLRKMLAAKNPAKRDVPVWFTEIGEPVGNGITPEHQAATLVKAYVLGIAEGATRIHWFEGKDGDSGPFGLIDGNGVKRPSYTATKTLIDRLGASPKYVGWTLLNDKHYGFVFEGATAPVIVAWSLPGATDDVDLEQSATVVDPNTGTAKTATKVTLTPAPVVIEGISSTWVARAQANAGRPVPWGGDYSAAKSVSYDATAGAKGLHPIGAAKLVTVDGGMARDQSSTGALAFTVDPAFLSYTATSITITAVLRRNGADAAGFNLKYESTKGPSSTGSWYGVPGSDKWYTQTWTITDDEFVGKWGYNFSFDSDSTDNSKYSIQSVTITKQ
jgi:hypothetical protein